MYDISRLRVKVCVESCAHFDIYCWNSFRCLQKAKKFGKELTSRLYPQQEFLSVGIKVCVESCAHFDIYCWNSFRCLQKAKKFSKELTSRLYPQQEFKERHWRSKTLIIPSLIRTQHCEKRQWLWRCDTKLRSEAAKLMEFRWLVYISNFIKRNYSIEFYVHDDPKLMQPIFLCSVSCRNETKFIF